MAVATPLSRRHQPAFTASSASARLGTALALLCLSVGAAAAGKAPKAAAAGACSAAAIQAQLDRGVRPVRIADDCGVASLYGRKYMSGLIASLNPDDGSGFVASSSDRPRPATWSNAATGSLPTGATATAPGSGAANTAAIVTAQGAPGGNANAAQNGYAAWDAQNHSIDNTTGWYLPSQDELLAIVKNVLVPGKACVAGKSRYWSSSELNANEAVAIDCKKPLPAATLKSGALNLRFARSFAAQRPQVAALPAPVAPPGATLTLSGARFAENAADNLVLFGGGKSAVASAVTPTSLTVSIPAGAQSGPLVVVAQGAASRPTAVLEIRDMPAITGMSPTLMPRSALAASTLTITGSKFLANSASNVVTFAGGAKVTVAPGNATSTALTVTVPAEARSGPVTVSVGGLSTAPFGALHLLQVATPASGTTNALGSVAGSGKLVVAGGEGGTLLTSADGAAWTLQACGQGAPVQALGFGTFDKVGYYIAGSAVVAGGLAQVCRSKDGVAWSAFPATTALKAAALVPGLAVALQEGAGQQFLSSSSDSVIWRRTQSVAEGDALVGVVKTDKQWLALGAAQNAYASADGQAWTLTPLPAPLALRSFAWSRSLQLYAGVDASGVQTSADGITWTPRYSSDALTAVAWNTNTGLFLAVGSKGEAVVSADGISWLPLPATTPGLQAVTAFGNQFVAVGAGGAVVQVLQN